MKKRDTLLNGVEKRYTNQYFLASKSIIFIIKKGDVKFIETRIRQECFGRLVQLFFPASCPQAAEMSDPLLVRIKTEYCSFLSIS